MTLSVRSVPVPLSHPLSETTGHLRHLRLVMDLRSRLHDFLGQLVTNLTSAFGRVTPDTLVGVYFRFSDQTGCQALDVEKKPESAPSNNRGSKACPPTLSHLTFSWKPLSGDAVNCLPRF